MVPRTRYNKERYGEGQCRSEDSRRMEATGQDHSKYSSRGEVDSMQQRSEAVG